MPNYAQSEITYARAEFGMQILQQKFWDKKTRLQYSLQFNNKLKSLQIFLDKYNELSVSK